MHLLKGDFEVLVLDVFLYISLNLYVCHIAHLTEGNLNLFKKNSLLPFLLISMHIGLGPLTNPPEIVKMRKMTLHFYVIFAKILISAQLKNYNNFILSYIRGAWGVVGCILDLPKGSERNHMIVFGEV